MKKLVHLLAVTLVVLGISGGAVQLRAQTKSTVDEKTAIEALYKDYDSAFNKRDVNGVMAAFAPGVFVFDAVPPRQFSGWAAYKRDWEGLLGAYPGPVTNSFLEMSITVAGTVAYTHYIDDTTFTAKDGSKLHTVVRATDVLRKTKGKWLIVQEHVSFPVDLATGKADLLSKP